MRLPLIFTAAAIVIGATAPAAATENPRGPLTPAQREAGCTMRFDHTPAGKTPRLPAEVHCPAKAVAALDQAKRAELRDTVRRD